MEKEIAAHPSGQTDSSEASHRATLLSMCAAVQQEHIRCEHSKHTKAQAESRSCMPSRSNPCWTPEKRATGVQRQNASGNTCFIRTQRNWRRDHVDDCWRLEGPQLRFPPSRMKSSILWHAVCALFALNFMNVWPAAEAVTSIYVVPVYEWTLIWSEWRNNNYGYGSIWRPTMIAEFSRAHFPGEKNVEVDGYNIRDYMSLSAEVIHLGDVFVKGHAKPAFVGTVLVIDPDSTGCPLGVPCFDRPDNALWSGLLFVTPDKNQFEKVWDSHIKQCVIQSEENIPFLCPDEEEALGLCEKESGFAANQIPGAVFRPSCPSDFYVMGHIALRESDGISIRSPIPSTYKCLHETLLRKVDFQPQPLFTGAQPGTSVWNPGLVAEEYAAEVSLWAPDCTPEYCDTLAGSGVNPGCVDTISIGLFYGASSETTKNYQITGQQDTAPVTGPRCLARFRDCTRVQADGVLLTNTGAGWDGVSDCDVEYGVGSDDLPLRGLLAAVPSGLPTAFHEPIELTLLVDKQLCDEIAPPGQEDNEGLVRINGYRTTWESLDQNDPAFCQIRVTVSLPPGDFAPGPARVEIKTYNGDVIPPIEGDIILSDVLVGVSYGMLYLYNDPSQEAELIEPKVLNSDDCALYVIIKLPATTQMLGFGGTNFMCFFRTGNESQWREGSNPRGVYKDWLGYRAIQCGIPQKTDRRVDLRVSMNGGDVWHILRRSLIRLGSVGSTIPSDKALRLYDVIPRTGPQEGGTKITLFGEYFSTFCNDDYCNNLQCNFVCGTSQVHVYVDAEFVSDTVLTCVTPPARPEVENCTVQTAVDTNGPCSSVADDPHSYNKIPFLYQTDLTRAAVPPASECCSDDPRETPHRLQGDWHQCESNSSSGYVAGIDCGNLPGVSDLVKELGYFSCLGGFKPRSNGTEPSPNATEATTNVQYPVWCMRAFPMNAGRHYAITLFDPFMKVSAFVLRKVPLQHPGHCHRTNHHVPWVRLTEPLDYRRFDLTDREYYRGQEVPRRGKETQGRNLIDRLFSTTALDLTASYMRDKLHSIGEEYGFLDLSLAFSIELDFTFASGYDRRQHRRQIQCSAAAPEHGFFSGNKGDDGPGGTYWDWFRLGFERGLPSCSPDERWKENCETTVVTSPNKEDDIGVMLTKPATVSITQRTEDAAVGCGRMRVAFNCSSFSLEECIRTEVETYSPNGRYRHVGAQTQYTSYTSWCNFMYPALAGPNNPQGWNAEGGTEGSKDWRYFARTSPCVRCRQAQEVCDALEVDPARLPIENNIPKGTIPSTLGDLNIAAEINLGCFGPEKFGGGVEDQCCDDVVDMDRGTSDVRVPGPCVRTLERCVRPGIDFLCARRNMDDLTDLDCSYNRDTQEVPLCAPKNLV